LKLPQKTQTNVPKLPHLSPTASAGAANAVALDSNKQSVNVKMSLELAITYFVNRKGTNRGESLREKGHGGHWVKWWRERKECRDVLLIALLNWGRL
jgi:hypothetical protein